MKCQSQQGQRPRRPRQGMEEMKESVNFNRFVDAFREHDRQGQFTYQGKRALFDYLESMEESGEPETELDVIAFCCEFTEYANLEELQKDYTDIESMDDLENQTSVIKIEGTEGFIIVAY